MRSYSSLLVLETLFDSLITSDTTLCSVAHQLFHPRCNVVEDQCLTQLGEVIDVNFEIEGRVELATSIRISRQRISELLGQGVYKVRTRTLSTCISKGGVCAACYSASRPLAVRPEVGDVVIVEPIFDKGAEVISPVLPGTTIKLGLDRDMYDTAIVFIGGQLRGSGSYSISGTDMVFNSPLPSGTNLVVWYQSLTRVPFMLWLAKTYSGSLLGVKSLPGPLLPIRSLLLSEILADAPLNLFLEQSKEIAGIPENMLRFAESTEDLLERTLFLLSLRILYDQQRYASDISSNICYSCTTQPVEPPVAAVSLVVSTDSATLDTGTTTLITFTFSGGIGDSFALEDITVTGGTLGPLSGSGLVRTATFTAGSAAGPASISVATGSYSDTAFPVPNPGLGNYLSLQILDVTAPTLVISSGLSQLDAGATTIITFTFSENIGTSFDHSDITVTGGTLGPLSGSGLVRTAVFTAGAAGPASISVAMGSYLDTALTAPNPGLGASLVITINTVPVIKLSGQILACIFASRSGVVSSKYLLPEYTSEPTWDANFNGTSEIGLFAVVHDGFTSSRDTGEVSKLISPFYISDVLTWTSHNNVYYGDICNMSIELIDGGGDVKAAIKTSPAGDFTHYLSYGNNLQTMTIADRSGSYPQTNGNLTFTANSVTFTNLGVGAFNQSFFFNCDLTNVTSIRVSGRAISNYPDNSAGTILRITRI